MNKEYGLIGMVNRELLWGVICIVLVFYMNISYGQDRGEKNLDSLAKESAYSTANLAVTEKTRFKNDLLEAMAVSKDYFELLAPSREETLQFKEAVNRLKIFSEEFPESEFKDDALVVYVCLSFIDAIIAEDQTKAKILIENMQNIIDRYPGDRLQDLTLQASKKVIPHDIADAFLQIPYKYILLYMKGIAGWEFKDYEETVNNYVELKDKLDYSKDEHGYLSTDIYTLLVGAYRRLGRSLEAYWTAKEAMDKFPDNRGLRRAMKSIVEEGGDNGNQD